MTRDCIIKRAHFIHFTIIVGEETTFFFDDIYQYYRLLIYIILTFNIIKIPYSINFLTIFSMDFNNGNQIFIFDLILFFIIIHLETNQIANFDSNNMVVQNI